MTAGLVAADASGGRAKAMICLRSVCKQFGTRSAVEHLDLEVGRGEIFGLLGHNGAGKSTAIGMMLGQVWPTAGEVMVCGANVTRHRADALRKVGAIFETPVFYDYLSGWRNLEILAQYSGRTTKDRIREVVEWVGLAGREKSKVRSYSHGMRARLALAQALLPAPELLILDEPSDGLDPEGIHEMRDTIHRLNREFGLTILLSSHLLNEVEQLCTRIAVLRKGRKVFEGAMEEATVRGRWVRLRVTDFPLAVRKLIETRLISESKDDCLLSLCDGVEPPEIINELVKGGFRIYEISPAEQTLEAFYLQLSRQDPS